MSEQIISLVSQVKTVHCRFGLYIINYSYVRSVKCSTSSNHKAKLVTEFNITPSDRSINADWWQYQLSKDQKSRIKKSAIEYSWWVCLSPFVHLFAFLRTNKSIKPYNLNLKNNLKVYFIVLKDICILHALNCKTLLSHLNHQTTSRITLL